MHNNIVSKGAYTHGIAGFRNIGIQIFTMISLPRLVQSFIYIIINYSLCVIVMSKASQI